MEQSAKHLTVDGPVGLAPAGSSETTLSAWSGYDWCEEVSLNQLSPSDRIVITTRNHTYEVVVTAPDTGEVLVRGGTIFPQFTAARLAGSTLGGGVMKVRTVNVGFRVQFAINAFAPIITTPVQTLAVVHH